MTLHHSGLPAAVAPAAGAADAGAVDQVASEAQFDDDDAEAVSLDLYFRGPSNV